MEGYQWGGGKGRIAEKVQGIRSINDRYEIDRGEVKNSMGNGEAKELTCTTHVHELRGCGMWVGEGCRMEGDKSEKNNGMTIIA